MSILPACMPVHHMHAYQVYTEVRRRHPETGVIDSSEPPGRYWELNQGPLEEYQVLLTSRS